MLKPHHVFRLVLVAAWGLCALAFLPVAEAAIGGDGLLSVAARLAFCNFCHQIPDRSLSVGGVCLPLCARCIGIFVGFAAGWTFWRLVPIVRRNRPAADLTLILGLGPMVADGLANSTGIVTTPGLFRFATGVLFGAVAARALWPALLEAVAAVDGAGRISGSNESVKGEAI